MSEKISNIAKNTSYYTLALILQKIISFTYFAIIARALGPEDLGKYYFAISYTTILAIFMDLGLASVLTREVAKSKETPENLLSNVMALKIPLTIIPLLIIAVTVNVLNYQPIIKDLIYLSAICMVLDSFTATFFAVLRGFHNLLYESISSVIFQLIVIITGVIILRANLGLVWLMSSLVLASVFNFLYSGVLIWKKWKISLKPKLDKSLIKFIVKITLPFGLAAIFSRIYTFFDSVMLQSFAGDKYVGLYQIAFKIISAIQFLPLAFSASLYPAMSAYWAKNKEQLAVTFERSMNYLIIISLPIAVGIASISDKIVLIFKAGFSEAILPLEINMAALFFLFLSFPVTALLAACDKQKINTSIIAAITVISLGMNFILIPRYQAVGASITVVITNILNLFFSIYWVPRIIRYRAWVNVKIFIKSGLAAFIMGCFTIYFKQHLNVIIVSLISGIIYFALLFVLRGFKKEDILSVYKSFKKEAPIAE